MQGIVVEVEVADDTLGPDTNYWYFLHDDSSASGGTAITASAASPFGLGYVSLIHPLFPLVPSRFSLVPSLFYSELEDTARIGIMPTGTLNRFQQ